MSATATDPWRMAAMELTGAGRSKADVQPGVIEAHQRRIEAVNPSVNAITILLAGQVLAAATAAAQRSRCCSWPRSWLCMWRSSTEPAHG